MIQILEASFLILEIAPRDHYHTLSWRVRRYPQGIKAPDRPNSKLRVLVTPARRGKGNMRQESGKTDDCVPASRHAAMTCTRGHKGTPKVGPMRGRLKRVFTKSRRFRRYRYIDL